MQAMTWPAPPPPMWAWWAGGAMVLAYAALDAFSGLGSVRQARGKVLAAVALAVGFAGALASAGGPQAQANALAFVTAYAIELALSIDNLFVFLLLFAAFDVPPANTGRVLRWGLASAFVLRGLFIAGGVALVERFAWLSYAFGAVLVVSGVRLLAQFVRGGDHDKPDVEGMWLLRWARRLLPMAPPDAAKAQPEAFFVRHQGRLTATPLLLLLVAIEASDVMFAFDSVPAGFAVTHQGWLLFAANVVALLALRALYLVVADALGSLRFLPLGLAAILTFVGGKMLLGHVIELSMPVSLGVVVVSIALATLASWQWPSPLPDRR